MSDRANPSPGPMFDVIMPAYNARRWISDAVRSVLAIVEARTLTVVDDGSREPLTERDLAAPDGPGRTRLLHQRNAGASAARNTGIEAVLHAPDPAPWVVFFDADDLMLPDITGALADADRAGAAVCVAARTAFTPDEREHPQSPPPDLCDTALPDPDHAFRYLQIFSGSGLAVRRAILAAGLRWNPALTHSEDVEFLRRAADRGVVWVSSRPVLRYREHTDGSNLSGMSHLEGRVRSFLRTVRTHRTDKNDALFREQGEWLLNQASKHASSTKPFIQLQGLHRRLGWTLPLKPLVRTRLRRVLGSIH